MQRKDIIISAFEGLRDARTAEEGAAWREAHAEMGEAFEARNTHDRTMIRSALRMRGIEEDALMAAFPRRSPPPRPPAAAPVNLLAEALGVALSPIQILAMAAHGLTLAGAPKLVPDDAADEAKQRAADALAEAVRALSPYMAR
jgi:hypothetical protein